MLIFCSCVCRMLPVFTYMFHGIEHAFQLRAGSHARPSFVHGGVAMELVLKASTYLLSKSFFLFANLKLRL